ncbi:hypothetical protein BKA16_002791 [Gordonia humi]|uniref:Prokaryotic metallothionein n=1 Tax=Gordonia humi TaxID=686429 RepID=A0A840F452_9ACTN|nr:hypothetical protein [Gordonia humi]
MATCDVCGNSYDAPLLISVQEREEHGVYDSFECAISALAPRCATCSTTVIGHGVQSDGRMYCCAACAARIGDHGHVDRVDAGVPRDPS